MAEQSTGQHRTGQDIRGNTHAKSLNITPSDRRAAGTKELEKIGVDGGDSGDDINEDDDDDYDDDANDYDDKRGSRSLILFIILIFHVSLSLSPPLSLQNLSEQKYDTE